MGLVGCGIEVWLVLVQIVLLLVALVAVPWMLFPKPLILRKQHNQVQGSLSLVFDGLGWRWFV